MRSLRQQCERGLWDHWGSNNNKLMCRVESPVHPWLNIILRPAFSLPAQVTSVVLFNIGPVTRPNRPVVNRGKIMFSLSSVILFKTLGVDSCVFLIFTTRVDQTNWSTLVELILFEKPHVELEFVFSIFTTRVRKHFGNSGLSLRSLV